MGLFDIVKEKAAELLGGASEKVSELTGTELPGADQVTQHTDNLTESATGAVEDFSGTATDAAGNVTDTATGAVEDVTDPRGRE